MLPDLGHLENPCSVPWSILQRFLAARRAGRQGVAKLCMAYRLKPGSAIAASMEHCAACPWDLLVITAFSSDCTASRPELAHPEAAHEPLPCPRALWAWLLLPVGAPHAKQRCHFAEHQLSTKLSSPNLPWLLATASSSNVISYGTGDIATLSLAREIPIPSSAVMSFLQRKPYLCLRGQ